jgi:hypothetical protein
MDPVEAVAATVDDDAETLRAIRAAAKGALDKYLVFFKEAEDGTIADATTSPLQWRGVSADPTSGQVHELALEGCVGLSSLAADVGRLTALRSLTIKNCVVLANLPPELSGCVALQLLDLRGRG